MAKTRALTPEEAETRRQKWAVLMPQLKAQAEQDPTHPSRWYWGLPVTPKEPPQQPETQENKS